MLYQRFAAEKRQVKLTPRQQAREGPPNRGYTGFPGHWGAELRPRVTVAATKVTGMVNHQAQAEAMTRDIHRTALS
jgi:hypothetical protein